MLKLTVITPTWNQSKFISKTIESVTNQTYKNIEYIIVDNCSDDGTEEIVLEYMKKYSFITYIREKDSGQAEAINKGLRRATGDIICWINSDDFYYSDDVFEKVMSIFERDINTNVIAGDGIYCDKDGNYTEPILCDRKVPRWVLSRWYYILQPSMFWRRQDDMYLEEKYHYVFDWFFFIKLQQKYEFRFLPECISVYRMYEDNKTGLDNAKRKKEIYLMQKELGVSKANTFWCKIVYKMYEKAERTNNERLKRKANTWSKIMFHVTGKRICSF